MSGASQAASTFVSLTSASSWTVPARKRFTEEAPEEAGQRGQQHRAHRHLEQRGQVGLVPEVDGVATQHLQGCPVLLEDGPVAAVVQQGVRRSHRRGHVLDRSGEEPGAVGCGPGGGVAGTGRGTAVQGDEAAPAQRDGGRIQGVPGVLEGGQAGDDERACGDRVLRPLGVDRSGGLERQLAIDQFDEEAAEGVQVAARRRVPRRRGYRRRRAERPPGRRRDDATAKAACPINRNVPNDRGVQEEITGAFDIRATIIGGKILAAPFLHCGFARRFATGPPAVRRPETAWPTHLRMATLALPEAGGGTGR